MDLPVIISIAVISICSVLIGSQVPSAPKKTEPFRADKAEWYYDEELKYYLDKGKKMNMIYYLLVVALIGLQVSMNTNSKITLQFC